MENIIIDKDFKALSNALDAKTFKLLEENIVENGCLEALVVWGDTLIDGHNRYAICKKHGIAFSTVEVNLRSKDEALVWIIATQVGRRRRLRS
ncbi:MAG: hypothetical protein FWG48_04150 [Oscillospiraceae bacterium]|nr:hypothetical protein [Oscillospiraceae bacterium]